MNFNKNIWIDNQMIGYNTPAFIIGEAGVNHNGDIQLAMRLVDCAEKAGVDAVKFQMFKTSELILKGTNKAPYQKDTTDAQQSQYDMLKELEFEKSAYKEIIDYCNEKKMSFLCTPFEETSLDILDELGVQAFKIAATDVTNLQFLKQVAKKGKPIILSAGMCYLEEVRLALEEIYPINKDVILLQCTANYPLDNDEVNLNVLDTFKDEFDIIVGFSDHSVGVGATPFAVAKGAKVVEKHFTLDRNMNGPDHQASIEPDDLKQLVEDVRRVETYLGSGVKTPTYSEQFTRKSLQKCFVAKRDIKKGENFSDENIVAKRTGGEGVSALYYNYVLNGVADKDYLKNEILLMG